MAESFGHPEPFTRGTGLGIRSPTGGQDDPASMKNTGIRPHSHRPAAINHNVPCGGMDQDPYAMGGDKIPQDPDNVLRPLGGGEDPSSSFLDRRKAPVLEEGDQIFVEEAGENAVQEFSVVAVALDEVPKFPAIGEIAATLARQGQFDSNAAHLFQEEDSGSRFGRPPRCHKTRGAASNDDYIRFQIQKP
jgi:hypothetical protein